ncbi:hypothetical protein ACFOQM_13620 [Paenibacillus sp. GCM10012307]|uniref:Uncharacterized protein n=1 Tax=Paenibacillus roseus TaxID=2798579 RepID=A0A934MQX5_9BACL|nr:hypothetical protein [Paenibacillus roseus]MBJ6362333.1 hypothetical protein [Paenibacillus roseus]
MSDTYQVYIADGRKHFLHGTAGHSCSAYALSIVPTVLEWMELDVKPTYDITERLQTVIQQLEIRKQNGWKSRS